MVHAGIPFRILDLIFWQTFMNTVQGLVKVYEKFVDRSNLKYLSQYKKKNSFELHEITPHL